MQTCPLEILKKGQNFTTIFKERQSFANLLTKKYVKTAAKLKWGAQRRGLISIDATKVSMRCHRLP